MAGSCDLEVDVNGEEIFVVDKDIISLYSGRIRKLTGKSKGAVRNLKVIFHDFPGGAGSFELMTRFCYNNGSIEINPFNVSLLCCTSHFMEMNKSVSETDNLSEQTAKAIEEIRYWTWSELLTALKHCQGLLPVASSAGILEKCIDSLVGRLALSCETSPCPSTSSPDSSVVRLSCDSRSTESLKNCMFRATWWFEDLVALEPCVVEMVVKSMVSRKFDHGFISKFLFYYQKSRLVNSTSEEKQKIIDMVVQMLHLLDQTAVPLKNLLGILRVSLNSDISKCAKNKLEGMIGSLLDQATLDSLLIPSPIRSSSLYDVNLVLRLVKSFIGRGACYVPLTRLNKVSSLMDLYLAEVAPDPCLKPSKFLGLVRALPEFARSSFDGIYRAMDLYLEVHTGLSEEERIQICCTLNYEKLSSEVFNHLTRNTKFPSKSSVQALISQQWILKNLLQDTNQPSPFVDSPCSLMENQSKGKEDDQIVLYAGKIDFSTDNEKLRAHLQGMQWRVLELEKACRRMHSQMAKIMKSRLSGHSSARSLPKLCS